MKSGNQPLVLVGQPYDFPVLYSVACYTAWHYQELFAFDGIELVFEDEALRAIGAIALERQTGARGLRSICETILRDPMFELPGTSGVRRVVVHPACVIDGALPRYEP